MIKKLSLLLALPLLLNACGSEPPAPVNAVEVGEQTYQKLEGGKAVDELAANSIADSDTVGKAKYLLGALQEEYKKANGVVPGIGKVTVLVDDNLTVILKNEFEGKVYETRASLKSLDPVAGHIKIIVDENPGEFPGLKIPVLEGQSKVMKLENGSSKSKEDYLEIILADRDGVQRVTSALLSAVQVAHGQL